MPKGIRKLLKIRENSPNPENNLFGTKNIDNQHFTEFSFKKDTAGGNITDETIICEIVKNHGEEYISLTCQIFPRVKNEFENRNEFSLSCFCPEVVDIINNINEKINMIDEEGNDSLEFKIRKTLIDIIEKDELELHYKLIISFQMLIGILENTHIGERKLLRQIDQYKDNKYMKETAEMYKEINLNIEESIEEINNLFLDIVDNYRDVLCLEDILWEISSFAEEIEIEYLCEQWKKYKNVFQENNNIIKNCIVAKILANCNSNDVEEMLLSFEIIILEYLLIRHGLFLKYCIDGNEILEIGYLCFVSLY